MKNILFFCVFLLFFACSVKDIPDNHIEGASLTGQVIKEYTNEILSKDDLIKYAESSEKMGGLKLSLSDINSYNTGSILDIYFKPFYKGKAVLPEEIYPKGMPMRLYYNWNENGYWYDSYGRNFDSTIVPNKIILTNGFLDFADSSYAGYTILPIMPFQDTEIHNFNF